jgi:hypothetical protein
LDFTVEKDQSLVPTSEPYGVPSICFSYLLLVGTVAASGYHVGHHVGTNSLATSMCHLPYASAFVHGLQGQHEYLGWACCTARHHQLCCSATVGSAMSTVGSTSSATVGSASAMLQLVLHAATVGSFSRIDRFCCYSSRIGSATVGSPLDQFCYSRITVGSSTVGSVLLKSDRYSSATVSRISSATVGVL